jgi:hypothetical protein
MSRFLGRSSGSVAQIRAAESVPVIERLRVTQYLRLAAIGLTLLGAALAPDVLAPGRNQAVLTTLAYAGVVVVAEAGSRLLKDRVVLLFSALLIVDSGSRGRPTSPVG